MLSTLQYRGYTAKVTNISKDTDITKYISECNISLPKTKTISSIECRFQTDEKVIDNGNEVLIQIFDEVGGLLYSIQGETTLKKRSLPYTYVEKFDYILKDNIDNLYQKTISETMVFYDLYLCNNADPTNSLLHIVAKNLGFENIDFQDSKFDDDTYIRVPFVYFEEDDRWIDKLQAIIEATNGILYIQNKKLIFRPNNLSLKNIFTINSEVLIKNIEESLKDVKYNAIKLSYDNFKKLDNQVVFNLASKIILDENTPKNDGTPTMRITYISSTVADPTLTKATGYYFTSEDPKTKTDITLQEGTHYEMEISQTGCEVKFFNPLPYKLYIDNFEIKGIPLVKYVDNEVLISTTEDTNPMIINKNPLIQTDKQAKFIANRLLAENILSEKEYTFHTKFLHNLKLGELYSLQIEDIDKVVKINSIDISLKPSVFTMLIKADEIKLESIKTTVKSKISANPNTQFIDLKPLEEKIEDNAKNVKEVTQKVQSKLHVSETEPTENVEEHDIWLKESSNTFKIYLNGRWSNVAESDLLPAIKHYNSLRKAQLKIGKVNDRAGLFLLNNDEKFGAINGTLAEVSIDKKGTVKMGNVNNLLEWNTKDPTRPDKVRSKLYMGVTDVSKIPDNVYFKIGDGSNGFSLEFKDGEVGKAKIDGVELGEKLKTDKAEIDRNINNLSQADAQLSRDIKSAKDEVKGYVDRQFTNADGKLTTLQQKYQNTVQDIESYKAETTANIGTVERALQEGNFKVTGNTVFDGTASFISRGTNERIAISNGSIDFYRTVGGQEQRLTRIKNIRYGTIATDSKGKGIVNFEGFKQPMIVMPSVKSANFGKNMASIFCYAEHIQGTQYRFYVGGTNEHYTEAKPVKMMGTSWTASNAFITTLHGVTGYFGTSFEKKSIRKHTNDRPRSPFFETHAIPRIRVTVSLNGEVIYSADKDVNVETSGLRGGPLRVQMSLDMSSAIEITKKFSSRTNVKYTLSIQIIQPHYKVNRHNRFYRDRKEDDYWVSEDLSGILFTLTPSHFRNLSITASAETSTLSDTTGTGEVSYIAMEID